MNNRLVLLFVLLVFQVGFAQIPPVEPKFIGGGTQQFFQFINEEINFSKIVDEKTMNIKFSIDATGAMNDIVLADFKNQDTADEVKRVLKKAPNWDVSNQKKNFPIVYKIKLIFEESKVKGQTFISWGANPSKTNDASFIPSVSEKGENSIYNLYGIEVKPEYPGGMQEFYKFIAKKYKAPNVKGLTGKVFISFVIEKDGSLTDLKVISDIGYGTGEEAVRVLKKCKKWIPAEQNGKKVRVQYSFPISIQPSK